MAVNKPVTFRKRHYKAKLETFCRFQFAIGDPAQNEHWILGARNQDRRTYVSSHTRFGARWFQARSPRNAPFNGTGEFLKDTIFIVSSSGWISVWISVLTGTLGSRLNREPTIKTLNEAPIARALAMNRNAKWAILASTTEIAKRVPDHCFQAFSFPHPFSGAS